jgi:NAD(P)-dependent dehydrogenase (short-subunit alcohol dehydrogenase family)
MEVILVTGANRGIGLALTRVLLANGNVVIASCRRPDQAVELNQWEEKKPLFRPRNRLKPWPRRSRKSSLN